MRGDDRTIRRGTPLAIVVTFQPPYEGQYEDTVELTFHRLLPRSDTVEKFVITRSIRAIVGSQEDHELLQPTTPYVRVARRAAHARLNKLIRGVRPPTDTLPGWQVKLDQYPIPNKIAIASAGPRAKLAIKELLPGLTISSYSRFFQVLLWVEEEQMQYVFSNGRQLELDVNTFTRRDLALYDMENVAIIPQYPGYE